MIWLVRSVFIVVYKINRTLSKPIAYVLLCFRVSPNQVTTSRLLIFAPINIWLALSDYNWRYFAILGNSLIGFWTDIIDGEMARMSGKQTSDGKLLDPLSDKALILSAAFIIVHAEIKIFAVVIFLQIISAIVAGYLHLIEKIPIEKLQANEIGKTKMFFYTCGFLLYNVGVILTDETILNIARVFIVIGIPLEIGSQFKKIKQLF